MLSPNSKLPLAENTWYRGQRFRSRLEARWAVFFYLTGTDWSYEIEKFRLAVNLVGGYVPDFWLPGMQSFVEVKGYWDQSVIKPYILGATAHDDYGMYIARDLPDEGMCKRGEWWDPLTERGVFDTGFCYAWNDWFPMSQPFVREAITAARNERFEFNHLYEAA